MTTDLLPARVVVTMLREESRALQHAAADIIEAQIALPRELEIAASEALDCLEWLDRNFPDLDGYANRNAAIFKLRAAIVKAQAVQP